MAQRGPVRRARRRRVPARRRDAARHARDVGAIAKRVVDAGRDRMHLPASPLMHGTGRLHVVPGDVRRRRASSRSSDRHFDPHELWQTVQRERVTQMAIVGDAFAKPMVRALEEAEATGTPYDISSLQLIISSGVMWSTEVKQALMARGNIHLLRLARLERRRRVRGLDQRARLRARRPRSSRSARARRCSPTTAARSCPAPARSACSRSAATSPSATTRTRRKSDGDVPRDQRRALVGARRLRERRGRRHRSRCSAAARSSSTPAARRSSPKRSRKR